MQIRHRPEERRFVAEGEDQIGALDYDERDDGTLDFRNTAIDEDLRGQGVGTRLVLHALDWARARDRRVVPSCPFVASVVDDHPEYRDLRAERG